MQARNIQNMLGGSPQLSRRFKSRLDQKKPFRKNVAICERDRDILLTSGVYTRPEVPSSDKILKHNWFILAW